MQKNWAYMCICMRKSQMFKATKAVWAHKPSVWKPQGSDNFFYFQTIAAEQIWHLNSLSLLVANSITPQTLAEKWLTFSVVVYSYLTINFTDIDMKLFCLWCQPILLHLDDKEPGVSCRKRKYACKLIIVVIDLFAFSWKFRVKWWRTWC